MSICFLHPHTPAIAHCEDCSQPICAVCMVQINGKPYCEHCAVDRHQQSPFWAGVFSLLVPGLGQFYNGDWGKGVAILLTGWLIVPWIYGIVDAVLTAQAIAQGEREASTVAPGYIILAMKVGVIGLSCLYVSLVWALISVVLTVLGWSAVQLKW